MKARNITAFFFIYSSPFLGVEDNLEIFSLFRATAFNSVDEFYLHFFSCLENKKAIEQAKRACDDGDYLSSFPFYTRNDRIFRYIRDNILSSTEYENLNFKMMKAARFDHVGAKSNLWMNSNDLRRLAEDGHEIGLHSHSHPTKISKLDINA